MKNSEYWKDRMVQLELNALKKGEEYYKNLQEQYDKAIHNINNDITIWYERLAKNNEISLAEAKKLLDKNELKEFKWTLQDYIKYGEENAINQEWMKELENASAKYHINKLQSLQIQMKQHLEKLASEQQKGMKNALSDIYEDTYYHTAFELQKGFNVGWHIEKLDTRRIETVLNQGWADGKNFSDRIWTNKEKLANTLNTELTQTIIRGEGPDRAIKAISAKMGASKKQAGRLVMTESSMIASVGQKDCFNELDVEDFEIVATLDMDTCGTCGSLDGTHLPMRNYQVGVTAPPFHANCRCCTAPYFADDEGQRIARNEEGKSYYIDGNMKYDDWYNKYVKDINNLKDVSKSGKMKSDDKILSLKECKKIIEKNGLVFVEEDLKEIDNHLLSDNAKRLDELMNKYPVMKEYIKDKTMIFEAENFRDKSTVAAFYPGIFSKRLSINLSKIKYSNYDTFLQIESNDVNIFHSMPCVEDKLSVYSITHEFGHFIESSFINEYNEEHLAEFLNMKTRALNAKTTTKRKSILKKWQENIANEIAQDIYGIALKNNPDIKINELLSTYGKSDSFEFFAECFANLECGKTNELGKALGEYLKKRGL